MQNPKSNVEFVTELMRFSRCGALTEIFIIDAIVKQAEAVVAADPARLAGSPLISGAAWAECAQEILQRMKDQYGDDTACVTAPQGA